MAAISLPASIVLRRVERVPLTPLLFAGVDGWGVWVEGVDNVRERVRFDEDFCGAFSDRT